ncbi:hypothetical protein [Achromobacter xylosoxidans]|uniref:hypothetical protein n=1 Tax=Alcaligenes xylosoxydans xylosoxydans TaxID=85698 RepID=UPI001EEE16B9|nr:hypothetical protein [Achromobacter xylosoxidans]
MLSDFLLAAKRTYLAWAPWIAGALILFNVGFFAGVLSIDAGKFLTDGATIGWAGAIATASATIAAVTIAVSKDQKEVTAKALEGMLHAVRITGAAGAWLNTMHNAILGFTKNGTLSTQEHAAIASLRDEIADLHHEKIVAYDPVMAASMSLLIDRLSYVLSVDVITNISQEVREQLRLGTRMALHSSVDLIKLLTSRGSSASNDLRSHVKTATGHTPESLIASRKAKEN